MKIVLSFFILAITFSTALGQQKMLTKASVFKLFKASIEQESKKSIMIGHNAWLSCNKDSAYFNNDTIRLYENRLYETANVCCDRVGWTFWKKDSFILQESQICKEPPTGIVTDGKDYYSIKIEEREGGLYLSTFNTYDGNKLIETFLIKSLDEEKHGKELGKVLTLVRIK
ncbi:hypothetical protein [Rufibacter latericius]|uniref:Lipocalin-like domain-containing protein n=1 Tax=Rufibacter latericius TaxID=2487040 RepID=A0A3M9MTA0_9BACT|nr:hypothetical protein [Rufibacter latericius]RNI28719.1 hypothetical protein EFB08_08785 [Rufibacter latericius]